MKTSLMIVALVSVGCAGPRLSPLKYVQEPDGENVKARPSLKYTPDEWLTPEDRDREAAEAFVASPLPPLKVDRSWGELTTREGDISSEDAAAIVQDVLRGMGISDGKIVDDRLGPVYLVIGSPSHRCRCIVVDLGEHPYLHQRRIDFAFQSGSLHAVWKRLYASWEFCSF